VASTTGLRPTAAGRCDLLHLSRSCFQPVSAGNRVRRAVQPPVKAAPDTVQLSACAALTLTKQSGT